MNIKYIYPAIFFTCYILSTQYVTIHGGPFTGTNGQIIAELDASHFDLTNHEIKGILLTRFTRLTYEQKIIFFNVINHLPAGRTAYHIFKEQLGGSIYLCKIKDQEHYIDNSFCKNMNLYAKYKKKILKLFSKH